MASNTGIKVITGIKLKCLFEKINAYGINHFFAVLGETPLKELIELENMEMPIWEYNGKCYLTINAIKLKEVQFENAFQKDHPYIVDLTFSKYDSQKGGEQITGYSISGIKTTY